MYVAGAPPAGPPGAGGARLRLARAGCRVLAGSAPAAHDPMLPVYLSDMLGPHGVPLDTGLLERATGHSYGDMAGPMLAGLVSDAEPADLLIFGFAGHDVVPGRATASHLSHVCPGTPLAFGLCDQGTAAAFSAIRLADAYVRAGGCQRPVIVLAEQSVLPYPVTAPIAERHAAVVLVCDTSAPAGLLPVRQHAGVSAADAVALLTGELEKLAAGPAGGPLTLVAGAGLLDMAGAGLPVEVLGGPGGQPVTGIWWELATRAPDWTAQRRRVVLADYEPVLGYLSLCEFTPVPP